VNFTLSYLYILWEFLSANWQYPLPLHFVFVFIGRGSCGYEKLSGSWGYEKLSGSWGYEKLSGSWGYEN